MARKWVINDGQFKMSSAVDFHRELSKDNTKTIGGGMWHQEKDALYLFGESMDFGPCLEDQVREALKNSYLGARFKGCKVYFTTVDSVFAAIEAGALVYEPTEHDS
jgi:hypothetical protein